MVKLLHIKERVAQDALIGPFRMRDIRTMSRKAEEKGKWKRNGMRKSDREWRKIENEK